MRPPFSMSVLSMSMLALFRAGPERVRWQVIEEPDGESYHVTIHHAHGTIVESFRTPAAMTRRLLTLEDLLLRAFEERVQGK